MRAEPSKKDFPGGPFVSQCRWVDSLAPHAETSSFLPIIHCRLAWESMLGVKIHFASNDYAPGTELRVCQDQGVYRFRRRPLFCRCRIPLLIHVSGCVRPVPGRTVFEHGFCISAGLSGPGTLHPLSPKLLRSNSRRMPSDASLPKRLIKPSPKDDQNGFFGAKWQEISRSYCIFNPSLSLKGFFSRLICVF